MTFTLPEPFKTFVAVLMGALLGAGMIAGYLVLSGPDSPSSSNFNPAAHRSTTNDLETLRGEVESLRAEVNQQPRVVERVIETAEASHEAPEQASPPMTAEEARERDKKEWERAKRDVHAPFAEQDVDVPWASEKEVALAEFASAQGFDLRDAECRKTLCRAEFNLTGIESGTNIVDSLGTESSPWNSGARILFEHDEQERATRAHIYFAREGESLAQVLRQFWSDD